MIQCLNKINVQNRRLLKFAEEISENVISAQSATLEPSGTTAAPEQHSFLDGVNDRIEKIEQNINSNTLICRGSVVENLVKESTTGNSPNLERLKGEICRSVCGDEVTGIDVANMRLSIFGRESKCIKINCGNPTSKLHLIKKARTRKPEGIFVSEFLTTSKLKIFQNLRRLKKLHPDRINAVFTRGGNILYTLQNNNRVFQATSLGDLTDVIGRHPPRSDSLTT